MNESINVGDRITIAGVGRVAIIRRGKRRHRVYVTTTYRVIKSTTANA